MISNDLQILIRVRHAHVIDVHQLLLEHLFRNGDIVECDVGIVELVSLHLAVDNIVDELVYRLLRLLSQAS